MATPPAQPAAPLTFSEQELKLVTIVLQARGWIVSDAREDAGGLTIIARKIIQHVPITEVTVRDNR